MRPIIGASSNARGRRGLLGVIVRALAAAARPSALAVALAVATAGAAMAQMSLPGTFDVGASGAAVYSVPIVVPPGTAGMVPALTLDYSSQAGDGILGGGWALGGLVSIDRCPQTIAQNNVHGNVNYNSNDRFCLSGQQLFAINGGTYGADGTEYRTEVESFTRIISHGTAGNGPSWFEVHTKSGQIMQLGNTADSQVLVQGSSTARNWAVNQIADTKGNYITVTYVSDIANNGQAYPSLITYTGNSSAGVAPYNSVQFIYNTSRPDVTPVYQAGSLMQTTVLLTEIKSCAGSLTLSTCTGNALVSDYQLGYQLGSSTARSRLTSITLCNGAGSCLPPTTFTWQGSRNQVSFTATPNGLTQGMFINAGDFNGDGITDVLLVPNTASCPSSGAVFLGNGSGGFTAANDGMCLTKSSGLTGTLVTIGDVNADGKSDAILLQQSISGGGPGPASEAFAVNEYLSSASGSSLQSSGLGNSSSGTLYSLESGDFNGDGRTDILLGDIIYLSNGDGTFSQASTLPSDSSANPLTGPLTGDFDGDGCTDYLQASTVATGVSTIFFSDCNGGVRSSVSEPNWEGSTVVLGDFNGDGKTDVLVVNSTQTGAMYLSTGTGLTQTSFSVPASWGNFQVVTGDWNGDGKTDIALISPNGGSHLIFLSTGTSFVQVASISNSDSNVTATAADWNNDGATDLWVQKASGDTQYISNYVPDLITQITTGLGETTTITYKPLTSSVYTKGTGGSYPVVNTRNPFYVVSQVSADDGVDTTPYLTNYSYAGAQIDVSGRGFLGFGQVTATDPQLGIATTTVYHQDYPFIGLTISETKSLGSTTLNQTTNTYTAVSLGGTRNQVNLQQTVVSSQDLDGSVIPPVTTSYQYDSFGNATQVAVSLLDGTTKTTTNTYTNDTTNWFLGRLTASSVTSQIPAPSTPPIPSVINVNISGNQTNFNLWNYLVANGFATSGHSGDWAVTIASGVTINASATSDYAFDTGAVPSGSTLTLTNNGTIEGMGGAGGTGASLTATTACTVGNGSAGQPGGPALHAQVPLTIANNSSISGGGGGGGGGAASGSISGSENPATAVSGGGGGGGAGNGAGGGGKPGTASASTPSSGASGAGGSASGGGAGGAGGGPVTSLGTSITAGAGGAGGGPGQAGAAGGSANFSGTCSTGSSPGGGGAAGAAVVGSSNVTWSTKGNVQGPLD
jgi:hypothetical protein